MKYFVYIIFLLTSLHAADISSSRTNIIQDAQWLIDSNHTYSLEDIQSLSDTHFKVNKYKSLHLGFNYHTVWVRTVISNQSDQIIRRRIVQLDPTLGKIDFYFKNQIEQQGTSRKHKTPYITPSILIELKPQEHATLCFRIQSHETAMNLEFWSIEENLYAQEELLNHIILGIFFGVLLTLILYNTALYFSIHDKLYIYYVIYISGVLSHHLFYKGFGQLYLEPETLNYLFMHPTPMNDAWMIGGMILFSGAFLNIKRYKFWTYLFYIAAIGSIANGIIMLYPPFYNLELVLLWAFLVLFILIGAGIFTFIKRIKYSGIFLLGWSPLLFMFLAVLLRNVNGINLVFPHFEEFAVGFEAVVFSIAISLRVKDINDEKNRVSKEFFMHQEKAKELLELEVAAKTKELNENLKEKELLLAEINHRVKNNMQMIISMLRLQADDQDDKFKTLVTIAENRIRSLLSIHELIYQNKEFANIDTADYLKEFVTSLTQSYEFDVSKIEVLIDPVQLDIDTLIQTTLMINELVTNAIKYAYNPNGVEIKVIIKQEKENVTIEVSDNGLVNNSKPSKAGFGTALINSTVKTLLKGTCVIDTSTGYHTIITFPFKGTQ